jgi:hypothetical protein
MHEAHKDPTLEVLMYQHGFDLDKAHYGLDHLYDERPLQRLDIYICDGLRRRCFEVINFLGPRKVHLHTADGTIEQQAKEKGIKTISERELKQYLAKLRDK